jgi:pyruvate dehydrogenase E2 component (dihydrolipoamide acetyltransferase)
MATIELKVPDIGDFKDVEIIEVLVKAGDAIAVEQSLITVESDKASMEIPASVAGTIVEMRVKIGDKVSEGSVLAMIETSAVIAIEAQPSLRGGEAPVAILAAGASEIGSRLDPAFNSPRPDSAMSPVSSFVAELNQMQEAAKAMAASASSSRGTPGAVAIQDLAVPPAHVSPVTDENVVKPHASPAVRKFARELGVDLHKVRGSGPKQRITLEDVQAYVKGVIATAGAPAAASDGGAALGLIPWPKVDFAKFGPIEPKPLSRIKKLSGANLHRNWVMIPHVTNNDEADITDLEEFRVSLNKESDKTGVKYTMLGFLIKAVVAALKQHPEFNASLDGDQLVYKKYYHIGFAADTPNGLVVPVLKDADKKGLSEIARETSELAKKARDGKLSPAEMQGGTFSISSLGGIGGTSFTPIINAPEVAILGVSKGYMKPVWNGKEFEPRLMLPLSLSYDHRVIDGASGARFNNVLRSLLSDFRRAVL